MLRGGGGGVSKETTAATALMVEQLQKASAAELKAVGDGLSDEVRDKVVASLRGGGCAASKPSDSPAQGAPPPAQAQSLSSTDDAALAALRNRRLVKDGYAKRVPPKGTPDSFEMTTPMLCMAFPLFDSNGCIFKANKKWRKEAIEKGWLIPVAKVVGGSGKIKDDGTLDGEVCPSPPLPLPLCLSASASLPLPLPSSPLPLPLPLME